MFPFGKYNSTRTCNKKKYQKQEEKGWKGQDMIILHSFCRICVIFLANVMMHF